jgi:predicted dehydrogenase
MSIRFAVVGLSHPHIDELTQQLLLAGAELVWAWSPEVEAAIQFQQRYPSAKLAREVDEILADSSIDLVACAMIPDERAALAIRTMQHGKDFVTVKPGFTTLAQLSEVQQVQPATQRLYSIYFSERLGNAATVHAEALVKQGAIGDVIQTVGLGPHRLGHLPRPAWFFQPSRYSGILNDLASHQIDQFLHFTGSTSAQIVAAQVGNFNHPQHPTMDDFGDILLRGPSATGYIRVDWLTPDGLGTWGDVRLFILGSNGTLEIRKNCDLAGRTGKDHLFLVDQQGVTYVDCSATPLPYAAQLIRDIVERSETAMPQAHCFLTSQLALQAQALAQRISPPERIAVEGV